MALRALSLAMVICTIIYGLFAFCNVDLDPFRWDYGSRVFLASLWAMVLLVVGGAYCAAREGDDQ